MTCDVSTPYQLRVSFIRTSFHDDIRVLYNHTYYEVTLTHRDGGVTETKTIDGKPIGTTRVETVSGESV